MRIRPRRPEAAVECSERHGRFCDQLSSSDPSNASVASGGIVGDMTSSLTSEQLAERYDLQPDTAALLAAHHFDADQFDALRSRFAEGGADPSRNHVRGDLVVPTGDDLEVFPASDSDRYAELAAVGAAAISAGKVGVVLLAGGMATRFGGGVKALADVLPGVRFVDTKIADLQQLGARLDTRIPMVLMTSFQSDPILAELGDQMSTDHVAIETAPQNVGMRVTPEGELFRDETGAVSAYSPGHGDLGDAIRNSGFLNRFIESGGEHLFVTNVDNAAATLDPAMVGLHLEAGRSMTCETVAADQGATGGAPYFLDGHLQIIEAFRVPPDVAAMDIPAVNTNSLIIDAAKLMEGHPLTWFEVSKKVGDVPVMQFERLVGELSAFVPTAMVVVERDGRDGRFQPVKDPAELERRRPQIREILEYRGLL